MSREKTIEMRFQKKGLNREGQYWTEEENKKLEHLILTGKDLSDIAKELGRSESATMQQSIKLGFLENETKHRNTDPIRKYQCLCYKCSLRNSCEFAQNN